MRKFPLLALLLLAAPLGAVLPPPPEAAAAGPHVNETRGSAAPERPSRIYSVEGPELKTRLGMALTHSHQQRRRTDFWSFRVES